MPPAKKILTNRNGYWSKKINGKIHYFGKDYTKAVREYKRQKPKLESNDLDYAYQNVADLLNEFIEFQAAKLSRNELSKRTYEDYVEVCDLIAANMNKRKDLNKLVARDFQAVRESMQFGQGGNPISPTSVNRSLGYARTVFRFATRHGLVQRIIPYELALAAVPKREVRRWKSEQPKRFFEADEIRTLIDSADDNLRAMILLAINGGFNNSDIGHLRLEDVQPVPEVLRYARHKTFVDRVTPLWPETQRAIKKVIQEVRPNWTKLPYLFLTRNGTPFYNAENRSDLSHRFKRLVVRCKLYSPGKNFGALRSTFATIGSQLGDDTAMKALMGHEDGSVLYQNYNQEIFLPRLERISVHLRKWLFNIGDD